MESRRLLATFLVTNPADSGPGSLRRAITDANANPGADVIGFNLTGAGLRTITLNSPLPAVADALTIDGTTQPGYAGQPLVEIVAGAGAGADGLTIAADDSTIKGLQVRGFADAEILVMGQRNVVAGNVLGTSLAGAEGSVVPATPGHAGVIVRGSNNTIGGTTAAARNIIGGDEWGVSIENPGTSNNLVAGNRIGTTADADTGRIAGTQRGVVVINAAGNTIGGAGAGNIITGGSLMQVTIIGAAATSNRVAGNVIGGQLGGGGGVLITGGAAANAIAGNTILGDAGAEITLSGGASNNLVTGNMIGAADPAVAGPSGMGVVINNATNNTIGGGTAEARNVIVGSRSGTGVSIDGPQATGNLVQGNFIGADTSGTRAVGNGTGIVVNAPGNLIGGEATGLGNLISGNLGAGVILGPGAVGNRLQGNLIGLDLTATAALPNGGPGIRLVGARSNVLGGGSALPARNVISANGGPGISLEDGANPAGPGVVGAVGNILQRNVIGTDYTGKVDLGNRGPGVTLTGHATTNLIGGNGAGGPNLIAANQGSGVLLSGPAVSGNAILGNLIGTDADGVAALGNRGDGLRIDGGSNNSVGGGFAGAGNLISGNAGNGVSLVGSAARNLVLGEMIGIDASGKEALPNGGLGVLVQGDGNLIGGASAPERNVISGNGSTGILVMGGSTPNRVQGNFVGTDTSGTAALGNGGFGLIVSDAPGTLVGGPTAGSGNVVSANGQGGIALVGRVGLAQLQGNFIGTDSTGGSALGNAGPGVFLLGGGVTVGGASRTLGNVIAANRGPGIWVTAGAPVDVIVGNLIGTDPSGLRNLGNAGPGIQVEANVVQVGGAAPGAANIVAFNAGAGVDVTSAASRSVSAVSNFLYANGGPPIRLAPGANGGIAAPTLSPPTVSGGITTVRGTFVGRANATYLIQVYAGQGGEARALLGSVGVTTDASGLARFGANSPSILAPGQVVTASATDTTGSTSALSGAYAPPPRVAAMVLVNGQIAVGFTAGMDPASANRVANYVAVASGPDGRFGTADDAVVPLRAASYNTSARIVVLTPTRPIPRGQLIAVAVAAPGGPSLTDLNGTPLDGDNDGVPGGSFFGIVGPA